VAPQPIGDARSVSPPTRLSEPGLHQIGAPSTPSLAHPLGENSCYNIQGLHAKGAIDRHKCVSVVNQNGTVPAKSNKILSLQTVCFQPIWRAFCLYLNLDLTARSIPSTASSF
jgi:hypothetical protein